MSGNHTRKLIYAIQYLQVGMRIADPLVGLHLRVDHQWPPLRFRHNDRVAHGDGGTRQLVDTPTLYLYLRKCKQIVTTHGDGVINIGIVCSGLCGAACEAN